MSDVVKAWIENTAAKIRINYEKTKNLRKKLKKEYGSAIADPYFLMFTFLIHRVSDQRRVRLLVAFGPKH